MTSRLYLPALSLLLTVLLTGMTASAATTIESTDNKTFTIGNDSIARVLSVADGHLMTTRIVNKLAKTEVTPLSCDEFRLRISQGTHTTDTDVVLTSADFAVVGVEKVELNGDRPGQQINVTLESKEHEIKVIVEYKLHDGDFYLRKRLHICPQKPITLERVDVESLAADDAEQPYTIKAIYARGKWSPGLGQPLYTTKSGTFWGVEFPASTNFVEEKTLRCGYLHGRQLPAGKVFATYPAVVGVADDPAFRTDAFFDYINQIRVRPLRLQTQYNSWFNSGRGVNQTSFGESVAKIYQELVTERGVKPLRAYVIDDGWHDVGKDWTVKTWQVNSKFDEDFATSKKNVRAAESQLGLWMSPGCLFGSNSAVSQYRAKGFEALDNWMSLAGPKYMQLLEDRMVELTEQGVAYFKLDGLFGHLNLRNFELNGQRYGIPYMPQLGTDQIGSGDQELNDSKYDELKTYYLVAGTERLITIFDKMAEANPDVYIVISNGAYLSPWWLMHIDSSWMINAGDAARGSSRTGELIYRDRVYYEIFKTEKTQFPMHALFNHEPKKRKTGEPKDVFRKYLYMNMSRGTGFIELYIKPGVLGEYDWDVLAEGLHWAEAVFPTFVRSRMHGGNPTGEVYGYTAWTAEQGYVSIHNPTAAPRTYTFTLDREFGLLPNSGEFLLSSPLAESLEGLKDSYAYGETITIELPPAGIKILNFDKTKRDWSVLKELQTRNEGPKPFKPAPIGEPAPIDKHAVLGKWVYKAGGIDYSREFTKDGWCTLLRAGELNWKKPFVIVDAKTVVVEGKYRHVLTDENTLRIEDRYTGKRE